MIRMRLRSLQSEFAMKPVVVVTEKVSSSCKEVSFFSVYLFLRRRLINDQNSEKGILFSFLSVKR